MGKDIINISDMYVRLGHKKVHISEHPYVISLIKSSKKIYRSCIKKHETQRKKKTGKWKNYLKLVETIRREGWNNKSSPIRLKKSKKIFATHGRHRICILYYLNPSLDLKCEFKGDQGTMYDILH